MKHKYIFYNDKVYTIKPDYIKVFRIVLGITQKHIGDELGVSRSAVSNWENDITKFNYDIQKWYIEHGLLRFVDDFVIFLQDNATRIRGDHYV